jgi:tripartite ATP-independent transporter DctP family solute receptor
MFQEKIYKASVTFGIAVSFLLSGSGAAIAADYDLRYNAPAPDGGVHGAGMHVFKQCIEEKTGGRVAVKLFFSGALGAQLDSIEAAQAGTLDIVQIDTPITTIDPLLSVFGLPFIFRDRAHVDAILSGPVGDMVRQRLAAKGVRPLGFWEGGFRHITNNVRPINKPSDLKGVKMRTPGSKIRIKIFNTYGANASALPFPEVYSALQMGVYDGQENPAEVLHSAKFYEVQKYLSLTGHVYTVSYPLISEGVYQKLPWDIQLALRQCGDKAGERTVEWSIDADNNVVDFAKGKGMKVNQADVGAFIAASRPIWSELGEKMGADAVKLIDIISSN